MASCISVPPAQVSERIVQRFGPYLGGPDALRLNVGCALNHEPGFWNLDMDARTNPDIRHNLEQVPLPFADRFFDCILASHVLEHVARERLVPLMADLYRILKPGGSLIAVVPHGASDVAWECPHHAQMFSEHTFYYFTEALYDVEHAGFGAWQGGQYRPWRMVQMALVPFPQFANDPELEFKAQHWRNVITEIQVVLQRPEDAA